MNIGRPVATSGQADLVRSGGISAIGFLVDGRHNAAHSRGRFHLQVLAGHPQHANNPRGYYFEDGRKSAELLKDIIETDTAVAPGVKFDLLEFASGYGCVTRHLPLVMPLAQITACDIHEEAISFITEEIGQKAVPSCSDPKELELNSKFDIVFALSFFSHMPKATWEDWLVALSATFALAAASYLQLTASSPSNGSTKTRSHFLRKASGSIHPASSTT